MTEVQVSEPEQLWTAVAQLLRAQVSEAVWLSTFQDVIPVDSEDNELRVTAPTTHLRDRIMSRYLPLVRDALEEIGSSNRMFVVDVQVSDTGDGYTEALPEIELSEPSTGYTAGHPGNGVPGPTGSG